MICPLKFNAVTLNARTQSQVNEDCCCEKEYCRAWEAKAKYNPDTKKYEGDCRLFMLDRKVTGLISTHTS